MIAGIATTSMIRGTKFSGVFHCRSFYEGHWCLRATVVLREALVLFIKVSIYCSTQGKKKSIFKFMDGTTCELQLHPARRSQQFERFLRYI